MRPLKPNLALVRSLALLALLLTACNGPTGIPPENAVPPGSPRIPRTAAGIPIVRVRLLENQSSVRLSAGSDPMVHAAGDPDSRLAIAGRGAIAVSSTQAGWNLGGAALPRPATLLPPGNVPPVLSIRPTSPGSLAINNIAYRGSLRLVPLSAPGRFDVINDVEIDDYLKSVVSRELLKDWHPEAFRAQAIVARTYALHEIATSGSSRYWDLYDDERSQVYGGVFAETPRARDAADATRGIVVAYGPPAQEKIFKAYFSACCGGAGQNPQDAFGDPLFPPLAEKNVGSLCSASPRYTWGPITLAKPDLTRRINLWASRHHRPEATMGTLARMEIAQTNRFNRPIRYTLTDARGQRYSFSAEELRNAINADARIAYSSFILPRDNGPSITLTGHGSGHGVGMCQYCAQALALRGQPHESIIAFSYPGSTLIRAY